MSRDEESIVISVVMPVYRESAIIDRQVEAVFQQQGIPYELIVVDGEPDATTLKAMTDHRAIPLKSHPGRAWQMNAGVARAKGRYLLFLHADTLLPARALVNIGALLDTRPEIDAGAFELRFDTTEWGYPLFGYLSSLRSRFSRVPYGDQAQFIRRSVFDAMGGFKEIPLMEDIDLMDRLKAGGHEIHIFRDPIRTSPRRWQEEGRIKGTLRNWWILRQYRRGVSPWDLKAYYP